MGIASDQTATSNAAGRTRWSEPEASRAAANRLGGSATQRAALLAHAVEREVLPRLLVAHRQPPLAAAPVHAACLLGAADVESMTGLLLANDAPAQDDLVQRLQSGGASVDQLYLDLLAPTARRLGDMWEQDLCDFTEVTIGLWRLQAILREIGRAVVLPVPQAIAPARRILLLPAPGEQHTFGLAMVGEFFHRDGWLVSVALLAAAADLGSAVRHDSFDVVGISVACGERLEPVVAAIRAARRGTCNPALRVMVGGPVFAAHPELAALVGADAAGGDAREAVLQANGLMSQPHDVATLGNRG